MAAIPYQPSESQIDAQANKKMISTSKMTNSIATR
jgi:hypothetical protein